MANPVISEILRQGRGRPRRHVLAALTTGRVESNFRNLPGGDRDSAGWRQERASLYRNPTNLVASVRRFYEEAAQHDRGQPVGELAADVQRPAEQYRGRYQQHLGEARQILRGRGAQIRAGQVGRTPGRTVTDVRFPLEQPGSVQQLLAAIKRSGTTPSPRELHTAPEPLSFAARATMPEGYEPVDAGTSTAKPRLDMASALKTLAKLRDTSVPEAIRTTRTIPGRPGVPVPADVGSRDPTRLEELIWRGPGARAVEHGKRVSPTGYSGHREHVHSAFRSPREAIEMGRLAQSMGLEVREHPAFDPVERVHTAGSWHYRNRAIDVSGDTRKLKRFARIVQRAYGA